MPGLGFAGIARGLPEGRIEGVAVAVANVIPGL